MSAKAFEIIRAACVQAREKGVKLQRGPWFTFGPAPAPEGACAIGAVLLAAGVTIPADLSSPGFVRAACEALKVDAFFLQRFWQGWDRGHHVTLTHERDGKTVETKDDISGGALALAREFGV